MYSLWLLLHLNVIKVLLVSSWEIYFRVLNRLPLFINAVEHLKWQWSLLHTRSSTRNVTSYQLLNSSRSYGLNLRCKSWLSMVQQQHNNKFRKKLCHLNKQRKETKNREGRFKLARQNRLSTNNNNNNNSNSNRVTRLTLLIHWAVST